MITVTIIEPDNTAEENSQAIQNSLNALTNLLRGENLIADDEYVDNPWKDVKWPDKGEYTPKVHTYYF